MSRWRLFVPSYHRTSEIIEEFGRAAVGISIADLNLHMQLLNVTGKPAAELFYSRVLRSIGQSLQQFELKAFDIKCQDGIYLVQGWRKGPPTSVEVKERYTVEDLRRIDIEESRKRRAGSSRTNLLDLAHLLRTVGNYVDFLGARLLRVEWQYQSDKVQCITVQYVASDADASPGAIDEICVHIYKERKKIRPLPRLEAAEAAAN